MSSNGIKSAFNQDRKNNVEKENIQRQSRMLEQMQSELRKRQVRAAKRCLTSKVGERLRLSKKPAIGEIPVDSGAWRRIGRISESIFKDEGSRSNSRLRTDRSFNQQLSSTQNPLVVNHKTISDISRSRSPVFGGWRERSLSGPRLPPQPHQQCVKFDFVKNEQSIPTSTNIEKPNNVALVDYEKALENSRYDLKMIARCEVDRANRKVEVATRQKHYESKKQR